MISNKPVLLEQLRSDFEVAKSLGSPLLQCSGMIAVSDTHIRAHETPEHLVCRLLLEKKNLIYKKKHHII